MLLTGKFSHMITRSCDGFKRSLHHRILNTTDNGSIIYGIRNNLTNPTGRTQYANESWQHITSSMLKHNTFYIYLDKAKLNKDRLYPGHVVSFLTDNNGIIEESCISLRNGTMVDGKVLSYKVSNGTAKRGFVYKVKFLRLKEELDKYLFDRALPQQDENIDDERYLVGLPLDTSEIRTLVDRVRLVKSMYVCEEYILHSGMINDIEVNAFNCVTGFYRGAGVIGTETDPSSRREDWDRGVGTPDPSPQMSLWSYLAYIWNMTERNLFLEKTNVRRPGMERVNDDHLRVWDNPHSSGGVSRGWGLESSGNIRHYTTMPQKETWVSIWNSMSESDKLQSALTTDEPPNAEVAYYKGVAFKDFGPQYSGHAMAAFRHALSLCD
jgi:hypothetical protein